MKLDKLKKVLAEAWEAGEGDCITEGYLQKSADDFVAYEVKGSLTDEQHDQITESYRAGFMGHKIGEEKPEITIAKLKAKLKKMKHSRDYYKELYEYNNEEM